MQSFLKYKQYIIGGAVGGFIVFLIMSTLPKIRLSATHVPMVAGKATKIMRLSPVKKPTVTPTGIFATMTKAPSTPVPSTPSPSGVNTAVGNGYPSQVFDLTNWKETLPLGESEKPREIKQTELNTFKISPWFIAAEDKSFVQFRAPVDGVTTSGSGYPRSELREMTDSGKKNASWSSTSGTHTMSIDQAITAVPKTKKHVVAGQIHDADDDVIVIRLEYPNLYVNVDGDNVKTIDSNYELGKRFTVKFEVKDGKTNIFYNGESSPTYTLDKSYSGAYFKAGAYTQSNCSREASGDCNESNYGEVRIYSLNVTHQ